MWRPGCVAHAIRASTYISAFLCEKLRAGMLAVTLHAKCVLCMQSGAKRRGALHSGLEIPESLKDFWYPVEFSSKLRQGKPKAFSMFKEHWQLIRDADGVASCRLDLSEQGWVFHSTLQKGSALHLLAGQYLSAQACEIWRSISLDY